MDGSVFTKMLVHFDNDISKIKVVPQFQTVLLFKICLWQFWTFGVSETCLWQDGLYRFIPGYIQPLVWNCRPWFFKSLVPFSKSFSIRGLGKH